MSSQTKALQLVISSVLGVCLRAYYLNILISSCYLSLFPDRSSLKCRMFFLEFVRTFSKIGTSFCCYSTVQYPIIKVLFRSTNSVSRNCLS